MRLYVLLTSVTPLRIYMFKEGLARFSTKRYKKPDDKNIKQNFIHLTNYSINKRSSKFYVSPNEETNVGHKRDL